MVQSAMKQFVGYGKETTCGVGVPMTKTLPVTKAQFEDKPHWLDDHSWNGSMSLMYGRQQGVVPADFSFGGNVYVDAIVDLLCNIMGDRSSSTTPPAATTLASPATPNSPTQTISSTATIPAGTPISIDTGITVEVRTVTAVAGAGPYTLTLSSPLLVSHPNNAAVTPLYSHQVSLKNDAQGQPITHTFTKFEGVGTNNARVYPGCCLSELDFHFDAQAQLFNYDAKGQSWPSLAASSQPVAAPSGIPALASWRSQIAVGGTLSTAKLATVMKGQFNLKRKLDREFTIMGGQFPYAITRGELDITGKMTILAEDDSAYQAMRQNAQPQLQFLIGGGSAMFQLDLQNAAYKTARLVTTKQAALEYEVDFDAIINTTNAGLTGGRSPGLVTVGNLVPGTSY